jgi:hypothetical protein
VVGPDRAFAGGAADIRAGHGDVARGRVPEEIGDKWLLVEQVEDSAPNQPAGLRGAWLEVARLVADGAGPGSSYGR